MVVKETGSGQFELHVLYPEQNCHVVCRSDTFSSAVATRDSCLSAGLVAWVVGV
jgi:hypothetical protein